LNQYKHLLSFDLTSYGAALSLINQFVDDEAIKVFEVSPLGHSAQLILLAKDLVSLQVVKAQSVGLLKSQILDSCLIENIHAELLPTYLSQNKTEVAKNIAIFEGGFVSTGFVLAQKLLLSDSKLLDFRIVRTNPKNVILTATSNQSTSYENLDIEKFKKTIIENVQASLKNYF
jgi:hypothetical protein